MRISSGMIFDAGVAAIGRQTSDLLQLQQQLATGRRILTPADDPVASARALEVTQAVDITKQYTTAHDNASASLSLAESQLQSAGSLVTEVRTLAVQAGNGALSNADRRSIATQLRASFDELLGLANSRDSSGQYIFSGYMGNTIPFAGSVEGGVAYSGDDGQRLLQVSPSQQLAVSDSGNNVFNRIHNGNGDFATSYNSANTGSGVIDAGSITDPAKWGSTTNSGNYAIRFAGISSAAGSVDLTTAVPITVGANDQFTISINGAPPRTVTVTSATLDTTSAAALEANINAALGGSSLVKVAFSPAGELKVTAETSVSGSGVVLGAVTGNSGLSDIFGAPKNTAPSTFYDIVDASGGVNNGKSLFTGSASSALGGSYTHAFTAGQPISFSGFAAPYGADFGATVSISGAPADGDSFTIQKSTSQSVFDTLRNLVTALEKPVASGSNGKTILANDISSALANFDQATQNFLTVRANIGSRMNEVDSLTSVNESVSLQYQQVLSQLQDVDYTKTISDLTRTQTQLQAAQQSFVKVSQLSLFNYIS